MSSTEVRSSDARSGAGAGTIAGRPQLVRAASR
jgi:hypothetical protein